jgi:hypothetical protein
MKEIYGQDGARLELPQDHVQVRSIVDLLVSLTEILYYYRSTAFCWALAAFLLLLFIYCNWICGAGIA